MPKIVYCVTSSSTATAFLLPEVIMMRERGWDVVILCGDETALGFVGLASGLHLPMAREPRPLMDMGSLLLLGWALRKLRPDVLVASTPKAALLSITAGWALRIPARVYHCRGLRSEGAKGLTRALIRLLERMTARMATHVLSDSQSLAAALAAYGGSQRAHVLGLGSCMGVRTSTFRPPTLLERQRARDSLELKSSDVVALFVGRLNEDKGLDMLSRVYASLVKNRPEVGERALLVIAGPSESDSLVKRLEESLAGTRHRLVTGLVDPSRFFAAADFFVYPSRREGFPIAPLEAQAVGLPVITTDATGCIDCVLDGQTGVVVPKESSGELSAALDLLFSDTGVRLRMGSAARTWVCDNFEQDKVVAQRVEWLHSVYQAG